MKIVKYILAVIFIIGAIGALAQGVIGAAVMFLILGVILLPPISDSLKEMFKFWKGKEVRYVSYIVLFIVAGAFLPKNYGEESIGLSTTSTKKSNDLKTESGKSKSKNEVKNGEDGLIYFDGKGNVIKKREDNKKKGNSKKYKFESCDFAGGSFYIIPDMIAADVYINFEDKGFTVDKSIKVRGTSIYCELATPQVKYVVEITGCTPNKIISIEAGTLDYSGNHIESVTSFLGFVATLQYKNAMPEKARKWVEENINKDGATTTIGGVTFSIHFKSKFSKSLAIQIKDS